MSQIQQALVSEFKQDSTIYAKLWNEDTNTFYVFPLVTPEGRMADDQDYYVTYTTMSNPEDIVLDIQKPNFKINCFARTYEGSIALRNDVCRILNRKKGILGDGGAESREIINAYKTEEYELYDDQNNMYYVTLGFSIQFKGDNQ